MPTVYKKDSFPVTFQLQDWQAPTLGASWANVGSPYYDAGYYKDPFGIVRLRGGIAGGASASSPFTLPAGFRPNAAIAFALADSGTGAIASIASSGVITITHGGGTPTVSLESITFLAEA